MIRFAPWKSLRFSELFLEVFFPNSVLLCSFLWTGSGRKKERKKVDSWRLSWRATRVYLLRAARGVVKCLEYGGKISWKGPFHENIGFNLTLLEKNPQDSNSWRVRKIVRLFPGSCTCVWAQVELDKSTWQVALVKLICRPRLRPLFKSLDKWQLVKSTC